MSEEVPDTIERGQELLEQELKMWQVNNLPTPGSLSSGMNTFNMDIQLHAVMRVMLDKFEMTEEEFDLYYVREKLRILRDVRSAFIQARITQGVHEPPNGPTPPGIKMPWEK